MKAASLFTPDTTRLPGRAPQARQMRASPVEQASRRSTSWASSGMMKVLAFTA